MSTGALSAAPAPNAADPPSRPSVFKRIRESSFVVNALTSIWLVTVLQYITPMLLIAPLALVPVVGKPLYRKLTGWYDIVARIGTMAVPASWCGLQIYLDRKGVKGFLELKEKGNALILSTHCSRIDYMIGAWVAADGGRALRIGFVAEATAALMPIQGWWRYLLGDIFVTRAFHHDGPRIQANIDEFHASGIERLLFLAPEGYIADPGSQVGDTYIANCDGFMRSDGRAPMTHLLTPRYKGMQIFLKHAPENVGSCTMAFKTDGAQVRNGTVVGGVHATRALADPRRSVPDLHSVFAGGLACFISYHPLHIPSSVTAEEMKKVLIDDQVFKDGELRHFEKHGKYPSTTDGDDAWFAYHEARHRHLLYNGVLIAHTILTLLFWKAAFGTSMAAGLARFGYATLFIMSLHGVSHALAKTRTGGHSRESLVGETAIKEAIYMVAAGVKFIGRVKKTHGAHSSAALVLLLALVPPAVLLGGAALCEAAGIRQCSWIWVPS